MLLASVYVNHSAVVLPELIQCAPKALLCCFAAELLLCCSVACAGGSAGAAVAAGGGLQRHGLRRRGGAERAYCCHVCLFLRHFRSNLGAILQRQGKILPVNLPRGTGAACDIADHIQFKTLPRGAQAGVARAPALRSLNLHGCDIGDEGCARF